MKTSRILSVGLAAAVLVGLGSVGAASSQRKSPPRHAQPGHVHPAHTNKSHDVSSKSPVAEAVRRATQAYRNVQAAINDGYVPFQGCVSGPQEGAMGVHFLKFDLFDATINLETPEALVYEPKNGRYELVAAEYIAPADVWHQAQEGQENPEQPNLLGHLFHYVPGPNRYGAAAFYELHVWAWKDNPHGTFADWNPSVSCAAYVQDRF